MIDERHEELAALYALYLLEGGERAQFEAALARNSALEGLVRELRDASASLAYTSAVTPPPALKARVLERIAPPATARVTAEPADNVIHPVIFNSARYFPWAVAACLALLAAWAGERYMSTRSELAHLRRQNALAEIAVQGVRQQLEADRLVRSRQVQDLQQQLQLAQTEVTQARTQLTDATTRLAAATNQLTERDRRARDADLQLARARELLASREAQVADLNQRIDALTGASAELGRQLGVASERIARLTSEMRFQRELADFKISLLASLAKDQPEATAVAVWDPDRQQGVLKVTKLPALAANQDYQLWVVDPAYKDPVDGGVFTVDPATGEQSVTFKAKQPVQAVNAFAVTRERKGGVPKAEGPMLLLGK